MSCEGRAKDQFAPRCCTERRAAFGVEGGFRTRERDPLEHQQEIPSDPGSCDPSLSFWEGYDNAANVNIQQCPYCALAPGHLNQNQVRR